jgi:hypothetical protein
MTTKLLLDMTFEEKISLVTSLRKTRIKLLQDAIKKKKTKKTKKKKKKKLSFKNKELEDIFNNLSPEMKKVITG